MPMTEVQEAFVMADFVAWCGRMPSEVAAETVEDYARYIKPTNLSEEEVLNFLRKKAVIVNSKEQLS